MSFFNFQMILQAVQGKALSERETEYVGVSTDTRVEMKGKIFFALRGENFNAHNFLSQAVIQGAKLLIIDEEPADLAEVKNQVSVIKVKDTLIALQKLANAWRMKNKFKVVGITGSNGKTTTKQFCADILKTKYKISYSKGSFNNHWGVPLSLLDTPADSEVVIIEMGMNHRGEITKLCEIAAPDIVVCTTVGSSHVGELGSIQEVKKAKEEIYIYSPQAIAIFNIANEYTMDMYKSALKRKSHERIYTFSNFSLEKPNVCLRITEMTLTTLSIVGHIDGVEGAAKLNLFGRQNINNLMAASCVALACGMMPEEIWQALPECKTIWGRNQLLKTKSGADVIFDGYNANLESMTALIKNLYEINTSGKKIIILGQMLELGEFTSSYHNQLGLLVGKSNFDFVWFMGPSSKDFKDGIDASNFKKTFIISNAYEETLASEVHNMLNVGDIVVIKGSRGMKLERVLEKLEPIDYIKK